MPTIDRKLKVFLCHATQDKPVVPQGNDMRELYRHLVAVKQGKR